MKQKDVNIYDLLNDVHVDTDCLDEHTMDSKEKSRIFKYVKRNSSNTNTKRKRLPVAACMLMLVGVLSVTPIGNTVLAYTNSLFFDLAVYLGIERDLTNYEAAINQSKTCNDITIGLNSVVVDNDRLIVSSSTQTSNKIENISERLSTDLGNITINGSIKSVAGGGSMKKIDDNTTQQVMTYHFDKPIPKGNIRISLDFNVTLDEKPIEGEWNFDFMANGDRLSKDTLRQKLNHSFTLPNEEVVTLSRITTSNLDYRIYYEKTGNENDYDIKFTGHDNLNNKIEFGISESTRKNGVLRIQTIFGKISPDATSIILTPYAVKYPEQSGRLSNDFIKVGDEFTIELPK